MIRLLGLMGGILLAMNGVAATAPSFSGFIRLPVDLYSGQGVRLEAGQYAVQVTQENGEYNLLFQQNDQTKGTVKGVVLSGGMNSADLGVPLIGTQYLRSSADPAGSEVERHFSKTGLPRYQEEKRDWKATLRAYAARDKKQTLWFFEEKQPAADEWSHVQFTLYLSPQ